ncbi:MAG: hypothetical protein NT150_01905 [Bacteroidetes bacterium]|nr:hypothetical protein [Bacteroidota bacterium]
MKKYIGMLFIALFAFVFTANAGGGKDGCCKKAECCKNCKDDKCKEMCAKYGAMSDTEKESEAGKKLAEECKALCEKNKCCKKEDKKACESKEGKGCCKH